MAEANFGPEPCKNGTDELCVVKTLVEDGPECLCCLEKVDEWFASYFGIFVKQAKDFLETQVSAVPGILPASRKLILFRNVLRWKYPNLFNVLFGME